MTMAIANDLINIFLLSTIIIASLLAYASADTSANDYVEGVVNKLKLSKTELHELNDYLVDYAHLNGYVFIDKEHQLQTDPKNLSNHFTVTQPLTLFPSPFPKELYDEAWQLQQLMALVSLRVSLNYDFLRKTLAEVAEMDKGFIGQFMQIMDAVNGNRKQSGLTLLLQRSDYLTNLEPQNKDKPITIKQIEVSTGIHGGQGTNPNGLHARVLDKIKYSREAVGQPVPEWFNKLEQQPADGAVEGQAQAFYKTWLEFTTIHKDKKAIILLVNPNKRSPPSHFSEKKWVQFTLEDIASKEGKGLPRVEVITFDECSKRLTFVNGHVFLDKHKRVAIIFHGGYLPVHFSGENDWEIRLQMEQSEAVMVPNVFTFLAGTKKVQQALAEPGNLEALFPELKHAKAANAMPDARAKAEKLQGDLEKLRATFSPMWGLGKNTEAERALLKEVMANPDEYVLKENLEGGRGNFFGQNLRKRLHELRDKHKERSLYILQKIIRPFTAKNAFSPVPPAPESSLSIVDVNTELGIFGALLAKTGNHNSNAAAEVGRRHKRNTAQPVEQEIVFNTVDGTFVRTKILSNVMCNLGSGMGGADSLVLFPMDKFHTKNEPKTGGDGEECAAAGEQFSFDGQEGPSSDVEKEVP